MDITESTGSAAYLAILTALLDRGDRVTPRGLPCRELRDVTVTITLPGESHVLRTTRRTPEKIVATEAAQLIAGTSSLEQLDEASGGKFSQFADGGRLRGAYGPRVYQQLGSVVTDLGADPDTRQAVATIWRGGERNAPTRDVPCTLSFQFFTRVIPRLDGARLCLRTSMRSNDAWLGFPIDIEVAGALHHTLAHALGLATGTHTHTVGSLHLYDHDEERARAVLAAGLSHSRRPEAPGFFAGGPGTAAQRWREATHDAFRLVLAGERVPRDVSGWYRSRVPVLPSNQRFFCPVCRYITPQPCLECTPAGMETIIPARELL